MGVWKNASIAAFAEGDTKELEPFVTPSQATGNCTIPPCDCDAGTSACSKGSITDAAQYLGVDQIMAKGHKFQGSVVICVDEGITAQGRAIHSNDTNHLRWPKKLIPKDICGWPTNDWGTTTDFHGLGIGPKF